MSKIQRCPFCESLDIHITGSTREWDIECVGCGINTSSSFETQEEAVNFWNSSYCAKLETRLEQAEERTKLLEKERLSLECCGNCKHYGADYCMIAKDPVNGNDRCIAWRRDEINDDLIEYYGAIETERDQAIEENERLRKYETQCNSLSQRFCKSLIAEGVPTAIKYIEKLEAENERLRAQIKKYEKQIWPNGA